MKRRWHLSIRTSKGSTRALSSASHSWRSYASVPQVRHTLEHVHRSFQRAPSLQACYSQHLELAEWQCRCHQVHRAGAWHALPRFRCRIALSSSCEAIRPWNWATPTMQSSTMSTWDCPPAIGSPLRPPSSHRACLGWLPCLCHACVARAVKAEGRYRREGHAWPDRSHGLLRPCSAMCPGPLLAR